jgi:putative hydrolase of the HAD superfamily
MPLKDKTTLFFDLDHTLWDFDRNAYETLSELYLAFELSDLGIPTAQQFIDTYTTFNYALWEAYHQGKIDKSTLRKDRFHKTFEAFGVPAKKVPTDLEHAFIRICPTKKNIFPGALEVLAYLKEKNYKLYLMSNGFWESTHIKLEHSGLAPYFEQVFCSDAVGFHKPDPQIFHHAMQWTKAHASESVMIGDSLEADVRGALHVGWAAIYFNTKGCPPPEDIPLSIRSLWELKNLF